MSSKGYFGVRLSMYDWPEVRAETRQLEEALQSEIGLALGLRETDFAPWPDDMGLVEAWSHENVLLTQTCGYPLTHALKGRVRLLGAPHYAAEGCQGPHYSSQIVVRKNSSFRKLEDLRGAVATYNGDDSQSGMNAFRASIAPFARDEAFFSEVTISGGHLRSMQGVAGGKADIACIDAVCWHLACQELPELAAQLRPIGRTATVPGLPFITSTRVSDDEANRIVEAVDAVFASEHTAKSRERLGLRGFSKLSVEDYAGILQMEQDARSLGYPVLR